MPKEDVLHILLSNRPRAQQGKTDLHEEDKGSSEDEVEGINASDQIGSPLSSRVIIIEWCIIGLEYEFYISVHVDLYYSIDYFIAKNFIAHSPPRLHRKCTAVD